MSAIIYDVAVSMDGFISGAGGDVSQFPFEGPQVDAYTARLGTYQTTILGRSTYEFGYAYGLKPGARAYPHMEHFIFSKSLKLPEDADVTVVRSNWLDQIDKLRDQAKGDIYLCGGGTFAGFLLENDRIDMVRLKRAPIICGSGTPLFGGKAGPKTVELTDEATFENGAIYQEYRIA